MSKYSSTGDGILAALKITEIICNKNLRPSKMFNLYQDYYQEKINLAYKKKSSKLIKILDNLKKNKSFNNKNIRSLVRLSGTEPLVRILVEGQNKIIVKKLSDKLKNSVRPYLG